LLRTDTLLAARLRQLQAEPELKAHWPRSYNSCRAGISRCCSCVSSKREQLLQEMNRFNAGLEGARGYEESQAWQ
jgi:hypothetical protein